MNTEIKAYSLEGLEELVKDAGLPRFRSNQLATWLYGKYAKSYDEMTNLPLTMREQFQSLYPLNNAAVIETLESRDGSQKYLLEYPDGVLAETVALPSNDGRLTVCCSSQAGCAMACDFCATGKGGFKRNLLIGEIVDQISLVQEKFGDRVTNVVVMGQGEPFANYENILAALRILNHPKLHNIGARHITISTCGIIPGISRFAEEPEQFTLAVSLHSANQSVRDKLMPGVRKFKLDDLRKSLLIYIGKTNRRVSFEYALMQGINDSETALHELIDYCRGMLCHVNLIPLNNIPNSAYKPSPSSLMSKWQNTLESAGISATIRQSRGSDISGACGQLAGNHLIGKK